MKRSLLAVLVCACLVTSGLAQSEPVDKKVKVRQLVRQLEDRERETRDKAESDLRKMGPAVLAMLPDIDAQTSGELKQRLLRIRDHLEKAQLSKSAAGSRVTLQGKMTLTGAFAKIEEQTGNSILDYRGRLNQQSDDTEVTLDFEDVPFWEAMDQILDQAGLSIYTFVGEPRKLAVIASGEGVASRYGSAAYQGLFRVEPTTLTLDRNLRNPSSDLLRMNIEIIWEPRVLP